MLCNSILDLIPVVLGSCVIPHANSDPSIWILEREELFTLVLTEQGNLYQFALYFFLRHLI